MAFFGVLCPKHAVSYPYEKNIGSSKNSCFFSKSVPISRENFQKPRLNGHTFFKKNQDFQKVCPNIRYFFQKCAH